MENVITVLVVTVIISLAVNIISLVMILRTQTKHRADVDARMEARDKQHKAEMEAQDEKHKADVDARVEARDKQHKTEIQHLQSESTRHTERSLAGQRGSIEGQAVERVASLLPGWHYIQADTHQLNQPIDFVIFEGSSKILPTTKKDSPLMDNVTITILEIKHGKQPLSNRQEATKRAIESGRIQFVLGTVAKKGSQIELKIMASCKNKTETIPQDSPSQLLNDLNDILNQHSIHQPK